ncbi:hypothetical protein ENHYD8BJ_140049 [Enhydrobacter sp. 8BJ]|jgi:hypothetical protein|nr:hypothetical protein ENHYD8BJ_140049 [Enhydrobacter sp. 8BJ]
MSFIVLAFNYQLILVTINNKQSIYHYINYFLTDSKKIIDILKIHYYNESMTG